MIKRNHFVYYLFLLLLLFVILTTTGCSTLGTKKVLILGNSLVSANDLPELFSNITQSMGKKLILESSTIQGGKIINHISLLKKNNLLSSDS